MVSRRFEGPAAYFAPRPSLGRGVYDQIVLGEKSLPSGEKVSVAT